MSGIQGYRCGTCGFETMNLRNLACGHWSHCPHYAAAKEAGTLPPESERPRSDVPYAR
jgi:hypothetical protein